MVVWRGVYEPIDYHGIRTLIAVDGIGPIVPLTDSESAFVAAGCAVRLVPAGKVRTANFAILRPNPGLQGTCGRAMISWRRSWRAQPHAPESYR